MVDAGRETPDPAARRRIEQRLDAQTTLESARAKLFGHARAVMLDRYVIERRIGEGGMGEVYRAYDPELARHVAIKVVHPERTDEPGADGRLLREAQALAQLDHPAIVPIHDVGTSQGKIWIAMELIEGETLRSWLARPHAPREILGVLVRAGRGLAAAHRRGILHRDFKPDNVMLAPADSDEPTHVRVTDFGLAAWVERGELARSKPIVLGDAPVDVVTRTNAVLGTCGYLAPELLTGGSPSAASDQFAFCVAAFEALAGHRPFAGETPRAVAENTIAGTIATTGDDRIPRRIRALLARGMASTPDARFAELGELLDELERDPAQLRRRVAIWSVSALAVAGITAVAVPRGPSCEHDPTRLDGIWDASTRDAISIAFVSTGAPYADDAVVGVVAALDDYGAKWLDARVEACEATHVRGEQSEAALDLRIACLDSRLRGLAELTSLLRVADVEIVRNAVRAAESLARLDACADVVALRETTPTPDEPELVAAVIEIDAQLAKLRAHVATGRYPDALEIGLAARDQAVRVGHRPTLAEARYELGFLQARMGDHASAEAQLRAAVWDAESSRNDRVAARAAVTLVGVVGFGLAKAERGLEWADHGRALLERIGADDVLEASRLNNVALIREGQHELAEARELYVRALELRRGALGEDHQAIAESLLNIAGVDMVLDEFDTAERGLLDALAVYERVLGPEHPEVGAALGNLAVLAMHRGDGEQAQDVTQRALAVLQPALGALHPDVILMRSNLAHMMVRSGDIDGAVTEARRVAADADAALGPNHFESARAHRVLGNALLVRGDLAGAQTELREALARLERVDHPTVPDVRILLARALLRAGDIDTALEQARAALVRAQERAEEKQLAQREIDASDPVLDAALIAELRRWL